MGGALSRTSAATAPPPPPPPIRTPPPPPPPPPTATPLGNPLPPTLHATADPPGRVIIVGDVHGCVDELEALLKKVKFKKEKGDFLVFVGDLVNKGPDSLAAVAAAAAAGAVTVRGNHDEAALAAYRGRDAPPPAMAWLQGEPGAGRARGGDRVRAAMAYLAATPFSLAMPSRGLLVVHAGVLPRPGGADVATQALEDLVELRFVAPAAAAPPSSPRSKSFASLDKALAKSLRRQGQAVDMWADAYSEAAAAAARADRTPSTTNTLPAYPHIVFGHHASARLQTSRSATGIDTGCVVGGELTALVLPRLQDAPRAPDLGGGYEALGGKLVSVKARRAYSGEA